MPWQSVKIIKVSQLNYNQTHWNFFSYFITYLFIYLEQFLWQLCFKLLV